MAIADSNEGETPTIIGHSFAIQLQEHVVKKI